MKLSEIIAHPLFPFSDFRDNDASFLMLELYWAALARDVLGAEASASAAPLQAAERDVEAFGDPLMIDFWIPHLRRGAKVTLLENTEAQPACRDSLDKLACFPSIVVYTSRRGITGPNDEIDQVCFRADMGDVARGVVSHLLREFLLEAAAPSAIEAWFDDFCAHTGEGPTQQELQAYYAAQDTDDE